jgi:hypothetical protein
MVAAGIAEDGMNKTEAKKRTATCSFSYPGTYNHECGKPAVLVFVKTSDSTVSGLFYSGRCAECAEANAGRDNQGVIRRETPNGQYNEWK